MTRRPVVNREELFFVADSMVAQGKQVTALQILAALGGGSLTTIYKLLEEWESLRKSKTPALTSSNEVPDVVQKSFLNVWKLATAEASREVVALKQEVEQLRQQLQTNEAAVREAAELRGRLQALTEQNSKLLEAGPALW